MKNIFLKNIDFNLIMYQLDNVKIKTRSRVLKNHLIFSYAFIKFYKGYRLGPGHVYLFSFPISSNVISFITGIVYWFFHKGVC